LRKKNKLPAYANELEEKVVELSLQLKSNSNELISVKENYNKTIGKLIHNLKNPVGVIFSFSEMMLEDVEDYSIEKLKKHIEIIKNSSKFSIELLNTVAKLLQLKSSDYTLNLKQSDFLNLISNVISEFKHLAEDRNITLQINFPKKPISLVVDEAEISIVIRNILNNAFRYSSKNTTITVEVIENNNTVETTITDEGIGISEENLPNVLNEFFVVNTYSEDKQKCIGLGLAVASKICMYHKGKISITSIIDKGSSFKISIPKL